MKTKWIYAVAAAIILASWIGNSLYYRNSQLPEAGFLRHYIEATDGGASFVLLYVANRQDDRRIARVTIDGLPEVQFSPPSEHMELNHQTIYRLTAMITPPESRPEKAPDPIRIHTVQVQYSDGTTAERDIGEIRIYKEAAVPVEGEQPFNFTSGSSSSDSSGSNTVTVTKPVALTDVTSAWMPALGSAFQWHVKVASKEAGLPAQLEANQPVTVAYRFLLPADDPRSMDTYQMILQLPFREADGREWTSRAFAQYLPYPSEAQMRAYVQSKRRERP